MNDWRREAAMRRAFSDMRAKVGRYNLTRDEVVQVVKDFQQGQGKTQQPVAASCARNESSRPGGR